MSYITLPNGFCLNLDDIIAVSPIVDPIQNMIDDDETGYDFEGYEDAHYYQFKIFIKNADCKEIEFTDYNKASEFRDYILSNISDQANNTNGTF